MWLGCVLAATVLALFPVLDNGMTNWDDPLYILDNPLIHDLSPRSLLTIVSTPSYFGNYHPLTLILLTIEYHFFGTAPAGYHAVSFALHVITTGFVFFLVFLIRGSPMTAAAVSILFGIHPMHVESVAWLSDQKDLVYAVFYLGAALGYLRYRRQSKTLLLYGVVLPLFLLSALSKGQAVTLPLFLLLLDFEQKRRVEGKQILQLVPFFVISIALGVVAVQAQTTLGAIPDTTIDSPAEKLLFATWGFIHYIIKLLFPTDLSPLYPYPSEVSSVYWVWLVVTLSALAVLFLKRVRYPGMTFGLMAYAFTILPALQLIQVGNVIMADRFSYIPSIGIFYILGLGIERVVPRLKGRKPIWSTLAVTALAFYLIFLVIQTRTMSGIWRDSFTLWDRVILEFPEHPAGYFNRGNAFFDAMRYEDAIGDFSKALERNTTYPSAQLKRGMSYQRLGRIDEAVADYDGALELAPADPEIYFLRGTLNASDSDDVAAIDDFSSALSLRPEYPEALEARALSLWRMEKYPAALEDLNAAIALVPSSTTLYDDRANLYALTEDYPRAIADFSMVLKLEPGDSRAWHLRGVAHRLTGDLSSACADFRRAVELGSQDAREELDLYCR